jgi:hypothetical protein
MYYSTSANEWKKDSKVYKDLAKKYQKNMELNIAQLDWDMNELIMANMTAVQNIPSIVLYTKVNRRGIMF